MAVQISIEKGDYNIPKLVFTGDAIDLDQTIAVGTKKEYNELMAICQGGGMAKVSLTSDIGGTLHKFRGMAILNTFEDGIEFVSFALVSDSIPSANLWAIHGDMYMDGDDLKIGFNMTDLT